MANLLVDERDLEIRALRTAQRRGTLRIRRRYSEFSREMFDMVLEAATKLAEKELAPTNADGDAKGVVLEAGQVRVPESFHAAYGHYCEGGWESLPIASRSRRDKGFPVLFTAATMELFVAPIRR